MLMVPKPKPPINDKAFSSTSKPKMTASDPKDISHQFCSTYLFVS
uniref:Ovule protein n=1 Tax=Heterorhabditis bacteriophora TaxID=37862 RepID=A0A1I7WC55_HETBA